MGDDLDGLDLPQHLVSGNLDRGHVSEINREELAEQAGALNTALSNYYSGNTNFNTVLDDLEDIGYTEERARQIRESAQLERTIRTQTGQPSNLTPNQLTFLQTNRLAGQRFNVNQNFAVLLDQDNRQYILDRRVREVDGSPSRLYLPAPEQFNPLTIEQQQTQQQRLEEARPDFLQDFVLFEYPEYSGDRLRTDFSRRDIGLIDRYSALYLADPTQQNLNNLRDNIDLLTDAQYVQNSNDILNQYFIDLQFEAEHRRNNNGRPQLLSEEQFAILATDRSLNWDGGNIYENPETGNLYYYNTRTERRTAVPIQDPETGETRTPLMPNDIPLPASITRITLQEDYDPNDSVRFSRQALTQLEQDRLRLEMANTINGQTSYKDFLSSINTEYSLSNQQFLDISQYVLTNTEQEVSIEDASSTQAYVDVPIYGATRAGRSIFVTNPQEFRDIFSDVDQDIVNQQINNFNDAFDIIHYAVLTSATTQPNLNPEDNVLQQLQEGQLDPSLLRPPPAEDLQRPRPFIRDITPGESEVQEILEELAQGTIGPEDIVPQEIRPIFEGETGNPPIVPGTTGSFYQLPQSQVDRYERYFNSRQNEFTPFRNMFRDFLPIFTGATGGYFAFSLARSRERGTLLTIIREERIFIENLEVRLENINDLLERQKTQTSEISQQFIFEESELTRIEQRDPTGFTGGETMREMIIRRKRIETERLLSELTQAESNLDSLEMDILNEEISRAEAAQRLERSLQADREILEDINRYNPEILFGFSIGQTLGLALSGYFFPEYVDIEEDPNMIKADNINYNPKELQKEKKEKKEQKKKRAQTNPDITAPKITAGEGTISRRAPEIVRSFIPTKANSNGTPLTYRQIQEYKSTLSPSELNKLKGKMLIFGADEKIIKKDAICRSVQKENLITKIPIKI